MNKQGKCISKELTEITVKTSDGCYYIKFIAKMEFNFKFLNEGKVKIYKDNICLEISKQDFEKSFEIMEDK